mgnify:CR=1 FL=1
MFGYIRKTGRQLIEDSIRLLSDLIPGQRGLITGIDDNCQGIERSRLLDMGFVPGTVVEAAIRSPFNDPTAYMVKGGLIALRRNQASKILISPVE